VSTLPPVREEADSVDLARAEADLNHLIERRAREASKQGALEDLWEASVKKDKERRRRALRAEWHAYFHRLAEAHARMSERFEARALELLEDEMKGASKQ
jgi:hypothetical protein